MLSDRFKRCTRSPRRVDPNGPTLSGRLLSLARLPFAFDCRSGLSLDPIHGALGTLPHSIFWCILWCRVLRHVDYRPGLQMARLGPERANYDNYLGCAATYMIITIYSVVFPPALINPNVVAPKLRVHRSSHEFNPLLCRRKQ
jgi:hypothetical protein